MPAKSPELAAVKIEPEFIDDASDVTASELAALVRQAGDFYQEETSRE